MLNLKRGNHEVDIISMDHRHKSSSKFLDMSLSVVLKLKKKYYQKIYFMKSTDKRTAYFWTEACIQLIIKNDRYRD